MAKKATAALVLGILSLILWLLPLLGLPVAGIVLGIRGVQNRQKFALAGLICAIIGLAFASANEGIGAYLGISGQHELVNQVMS
ncbi:MAG: hypothetical protein ACE5DM_04730 [Candidatus Nanoarchaeia archaeon]